MVRVVSAAWSVRRWMRLRARRMTADARQWRVFREPRLVAATSSVTTQTIARTGAAARMLAMMATAGVACSAWASENQWNAPARCEALTERDRASATRARMNDAWTYERKQRASFDDEYETKNLVGCGTFGMVMQCLRRQDGHVAAVKVIQDLADMREEAEREKLALASIQRSGGHRNIVRFDGAYEQDGFHYIVTEFVPGESLFALLEKCRQLDVGTALQITTQLVDALAFLRDQGVVHRDLKPENLMLVRQNSNDVPWQVKIIDFGSADFVSPLHPESTTHGITCTSGTRCYWPPEVLLRQEVSPAMDMWALGCLLFIMISGRHPFDLMGTATEDEIVDRISTDSVSFLHPVWSNVPEDIKTLIKGLLEKDPAQRLAIDEVVPLVECISMLHA